MLLSATAPRSMLPTPSRSATGRRSRPTRLYTSRCTDCGRRELPSPRQSLPSRTTIATRWTVCEIFSVMRMAGVRELHDGGRAAQAVFSPLRDSSRVLADAGVRLLLSVASPHRIEVGHEVGLGVALREVGGFAAMRRPPEIPGRSRTATPRPAGTSRRSMLRKGLQSVRSRCQAHRALHQRLYRSIVD